MTLGTFYSDTSTKVWQNKHESSVKGEISMIYSKIVLDGCF